METFGWLALFGGVLAIRQISVGRASNIAADAHDFVTAVVNGQFSTVGDIAKRRGSPSSGKAPAGVDSTTPAGSNGGYSLVTEMQSLAAQAGYVYDWGKTGPTAYDCSGLVWRALYNLGVYRGPRFTTSTFPVVAGSFAVEIPESAAGYGDIVDWYPNHMGVVTGKDTMFSALSTPDGIKQSAISTETSRRGTPHYWRIKDSAATHSYH